MNKKITSVKLMKRIDTLLGVGAVGVIIAVFLSETIAEHRVQAISLFIGGGITLWGLHIITKQDFVYPIKIFKKKSVIKQKGKSAKIIGAVISIIGVFLSIWGLLFWIDFLRII